MIEYVPGLSLPSKYKVVWARSPIHVDIGLGMVRLGYGQGARYWSGYGAPRAWARSPIQHVDIGLGMVRLGYGAPRVWARSPIHVDIGLGMVRLGYGQGAQYNM